MSEQIQALILCSLCFSLGPISLLGGACNWDWWMATLGRLIVHRYGRGFARYHFVLIGLFIIALGAFCEPDAFGRR